MHSVTIFSTLIPTLIYYIKTTDLRYKSYIEKCSYHHCVHNMSGINMINDDNSVAKSLKSAYYTFEIVQCCVRIHKWT